MKYRALPVALLFQCILAFVAPAQDSGPEVFLIRLGENSTFAGRLKPVNISRNPGYDNQPSFSIDGNSILYVSSRGGGATDVFEYFLASGKTVQITKTAAGEYSPRAFDQDTITFVREGEGQEMTVIKYDRRRKTESPALGIREPVGYYAWNYKGDALVWVRYAFMIHWVNDEKKINYFVTDYAQPSIPQLIPGTSRFSFMQRHPNDEIWIKEFDPATRAVRPIVQALGGNRDYCWLPDGSLLIGSGSKLFRYREAAGDVEWKEVVDLETGGIKNISRMSAGPDGKYLAVVALPLENGD